MHELHGDERRRQGRTFGRRASVSRCRGIWKPNLLPAVNGQQGRFRLSDVQVVTAFYRAMHVVQSAVLLS